MASTGFPCRHCETTFPTAAAFSDHIHEGDPPRIEEPEPTEDEVTELLSTTEVVSDESDWRRVHYKCTNSRCNALDSDLIYGDHQPALFVHCWKCKAGMKMDQGNMIATNTGMKLQPEAQAQPARVQ